MQCYGRFSERKEECPSCEHKLFCKEARDPVLLCSSMPSFNDEIGTRPVYNEEYEERVYTRDDLLEVVSFMLQLDSRAVEFLALHISTPGITFQKMAESRNITRQAVHKFLKNQCKKIPELAALMRIGERKQKSNKQKTFMEEVCLIRRKMSALRLKERGNESLCWRKLICSTQSSSLSNMNIIKGKKIWIND